MTTKKELVEKIRTMPAYMQPRQSMAKLDKEFLENLVDQAKRLGYIKK